MRKMWRRGAAVMLAIAVMLSSSGGTGVARAQDAGASRMSGEAAGVVQPDYELDFETDMSGMLKGTAKVEEESIQVDGTDHSESENHVLVLSGGSKGSSYVELPSDLYQGVSSDTGFTYSFWLKSASNVGSYTRLISSAKSSGTDEFAYAPYASDKV